MKKLVLAGVAAAVIAVPTIAQVAAKPDRSAPVTRSEVESRVRSQFEKLDSNKDGFVTQEERQAARTERRSERRDAMFARLDTDKDGAISRAEFDAPRAGRGEHKAEHRGHRPPRGLAMQRFHRGGGMFGAADADKDGRVSLAEATAPALERFDRVDADKDGTITPEERKAAREAMRAQWKQRRQG